MTEEERPGAAGGERMLRDMDRWKDRVELSLDNRQVFLLFFGCAVIACLVFVLGVMVGRRLEARARNDTTPVKSDPLAALDSEGEGDEPARPAPPLVRSAPAAVPARAADVPPPAKTTKPEVAPPAKPPRPLPMAPPAEAAGANGPDADAAAGVPADKLAAAASRARYTLQLSAFQERSEAEDFAKKLAGTTYKANIVAAEIPGRGVWYRVRVGEFATQKAALDAKADLERRLHLIAYVTRL